jgi:hypothetical protein
MTYQRDPRRDLERGDIRSEPANRDPRDAIRLMTGRGPSCLSARPLCSSVSWNGCF